MILTALHDLPLGLTRQHWLQPVLLLYCTDFPIIDLRSNTLRSIQESGIVGYGAARPTAVPEQDPSTASRYLPTRQCISRQPCWSMSNCTGQSQTCITNDLPMHAADSHYMLHISLRNQSLRTLHGREIGSEAKDGPRPVRAGHPFR